jgi:hypothetical protein
MLLLLYFRFLPAIPKRSGKWVCLSKVGEFV